MNNLKQKIQLLAATILIASTASAQSANWKVDRSHSSIGFSIDHLVVSETVGQFTDYTMVIKADEADFTDAKFEVTIQAKSIDTKDAKRDEHLKSSDFFNVAKYQTITFKGKQFRKVSGKKYKVTGTLTMHGVSKEVMLDAEFGGIVKDPWGGTRAGLKISGELDRYDYDLKYNSVLEAGGLTIGKEVRIECRLELIKG